MRLPVSQQVALRRLPPSAMLADVQDGSQALLRLMLTLPAPLAAYMSAWLCAWCECLSRAGCVTALCSVSLQPLHVQHHVALFRTLCARIHALCRARVVVGWKPI